MSRVGVCALLVAACGPPGDARHAGLDAYDAPGGEYRIHYLSPPWELREARGARVLFEIESNASDLAGVPSDVVPPKYELLVTVEEGTSRGRAEREEEQTRSSGDAVVEAARPVLLGPDDDAIGWEVLAADRGPPLRQYRTVYLSRPGGGVVRLAFEAVPDLDEPDVDAMIAAVEVDPAP